MKFISHAQFIEFLISKGIKIIDPKRIDFRLREDNQNYKHHFRFGHNVQIDINAIFVGSVKLGNKVNIGANCIIEDSEIADDGEVLPYSYLVGAKIKKGAEVGPYARIRPGTIIDTYARVGNFVEVKKSTIGKKSKANHLSYIGDSDIGKDVNIGAGTITCNYDGINKHKTIIEDDVFIGSNSQLIAPLTIGKGATIGAGTTLNKNAPPKKLTVARAKQITLDKWQRPKKNK